MTEQQLAAMKQALAALKLIDEAMPFPVAKHAMSTIRTAIEAETAQKQEPFVWLEDDKGNKYEMPEANKGPLLKRAEEAFESAKQREWVGLTDEELKKAKPVCADFVSFRAGFRYAESRYKERQQ